LLQDSVGGNCKTVLITNISPSSQCFFETLNSLKFADRAKNIKEHASVNALEEDSVSKRRLLLEIEKIKELIAGGGYQGTREELYLKSQLEVQLE
jgi:hypothetical protein